MSGPGPIQLIPWRGHHDTAPVLSREQSRGIDRFAVERLGIPTIVLMENAGLHVAAAAMGIARIAGTSAVVLAGSGNNAGDGFVAARHLHILGWQTHIILLCGEPRGDAAVMLRAAHAVGISVSRGDAPARLSVAGPAVILDAVYGTGLRGELPGEVVSALNAARFARTSGTRVVAVDLPSGMDCDTGACAMGTLPADLTVTFAGLKRGLLAPGARDLAGEILIARLGIDDATVRAGASGVH